MIDDVLFKKAFSVACGASTGFLVGIGCILVIARIINNALGWIGL